MAGSSRPRDARSPRSSPPRPGPPAGPASSALMPPPPPPPPPAGPEPRRTKHSPSPPPTTAEPTSSPRGSQRPESPPPEPQTPQTPSSSQRQASQPHQSSQPSQPSHSPSTLAPQSPQPSQPSQQPQRLPKQQSLSPPPLPAQTPVSPATASTRPPPATLPPQTPRAGSAQEGPSATHGSAASLGPSSVGPSSVGPRVGPLAGPSAGPLADPSAGPTSSPNAPRGTKRRVDDDEPNADQPPPKRVRNFVDNGERRLWRQWFFSQGRRLADDGGPEKIIYPTQNAAIAWFAWKFGKTVSQSTVSHSLSDEYAFLDRDWYGHGIRFRRPDHPAVEQHVLAFYTWRVVGGTHPSTTELSAVARRAYAVCMADEDEESDVARLVRARRERELFTTSWVRRLLDRNGLPTGMPAKRAPPPVPASLRPYELVLRRELTYVYRHTDTAILQHIIKRVLGEDVPDATAHRLRDAMDAYRPIYVAADYDASSIEKKRERIAPGIAAVTAAREAELVAASPTRRLRAEDADELLTLALSRADRIAEINAEIGDAPSRPAPAPATPTAPAAPATPAPRAKTPPPKTPPTTDENGPRQCKFCTKTRVLHSMDEMMEHIEAVHGIAASS